MKNYTLACLFLLLSNILFSQKIKFQILNRANNKPISGATITSRVEKKVLCLSDAKGYFSLQTNHVDTLFIEKLNFFPIYINVKQNNFDNSHIVILVLNPLEEGSDLKSASDISNLQSFEYHFVHDQLGEDSHLKISVMDGYNSGNKNLNPDPALHIAAVPLNHVQVQHKTLSKEKSSYGLKPAAVK